jgi:hypothetical protein
MWYSVSGLLFPSDSKGAYCLHHYSPSNHQATQKHTPQDPNPQQHFCGPCSTQSQAPKLISGPNLAIRAWLLSFNRTQSRVVISLLTGHNTSRRHLYVMGLSNNPSCRKCGTEEQTSVHILCECQALASLRHAHMGSFFFGPWGYQETKYRGHLEL